MPTLADRVDPVGLLKLLERITKDRDCLCALEKAQAFPAQGRSSIFTYGVYTGYCEMALAALSLPYEVVSPQTWQKSMHNGIDAKIKLPKVRSALKMQRLMGLDAFMVGKQRDPHDGLIDAALLAIWIQRQACGSPRGRRRARAD